MNKKITLIIVLLIIGILGIVWFLLKPSRVQVSISSSIDSSDISMQEVKEQVATATDYKLNITCENSKSDVYQCENPTHCKVKTIDVFVCNEGYVADNLFQLIRYQNNLFEIAQKNSLNFIGSGGSGGIASFID